MRLLQIYKSDLLNGVGLRNVYFFTGCPHQCKSCFNKETWEYNAPGSKEWKEDDFNLMIEEARKPFISGITLSGGDPFSDFNKDGILDLCKRFKEIFDDSKTIWVYTGFTWEKILEDNDSKTECLKYIDVLCDGPFKESKASPDKPWVGSRNQRVINVKESLKENKIILF